MVYAPLYIHSFRFLTSFHLRNAQDFIFANPDPRTLDTVSDKLKWYRFQNGLQQSDMAKIMEVDRKTYSRYEENVLDAYPLDKLEKAAVYYEIDITELLDKYNLFLYRGQGAQIKGLRKSLGLTQSELAKRLGVSIQKVKNWEREKVRVSRGTFEKLSQFFF
ncbi:MAG: transcriptional regulator [Oscillospiraceae bacterium]